MQRHPFFKKLLRNLQSERYGGAKHLTMDDMWECLEKKMIDPPFHPRVRVRVRVIVWVRVRIGVRIGASVAVTLYVVLAYGLGV